MAQSRNEKTQLYGYFDVLGRTFTRSDYSEAPSASNADSLDVTKFRPAGQ